MAKVAHRRVAQRIKEFWERTGVLPVMAWSQAPGLMSWFRRHVAPLPPRQMTQTIGDRLKSALEGGATEAVVLVPVKMEVRHGSGVEFAVSESYATGLLPMRRAREMAEALKEQGAVVVPYYPDTIQRHLGAHLDRRARHDGAPEPEIFTLTASLHQRMRLFGTAPNLLSMGQIRGDEPLPGSARLVRAAPQSRDLEAAPVYRPAFA